MEPDLFALVDAGEAVGIRASQLVGTEHSLSFKPARALFRVRFRGAHASSVQRRASCSSDCPESPLLQDFVRQDAEQSTLEACTPRSRPFLLTNLCFIPPFSP